MRTLQVACAVAALLVGTSALQPRAEGQVPPVQVGSDGPPSIVPGSAPLLPSVREAIEADYLSEDERRAGRVEHGVWEQGDLDSPALRTAAAVIAWQTDDDRALAAEAPSLLRAEALMQRSRAADALAMLEGTREAAEPAGLLLRAQALSALGRFDEAVSAARGAGEAAGRGNSAESAAIAGRALSIEGRLAQVEPGRYRAVLERLGRVGSQIDRTDWRCRLAEGLLLFERHNLGESVGALREALQRNPSSAECWYLLGRLAVRQFDFDGAERAAGTLDELAPGSSLAGLLRAEAALRRRDPELALAVLKDLIRQQPGNLDALALRAAAYALKFDDAAMRRALDDIDQICPGSALGYAEAGAQLALARQYDEAATILAEAIRRQPEWSRPQLELGLMEMQTGRDDRAHEALTAATARDPFDRSASFSLFLLDEMAKWKRFESPHFVVRCAPGIDEALAGVMLDDLEAMHSEVVARFGWEPPQKTIIDLCPDHEFLAVRITGMPWIHAIGASTGPVIAIEPPREGAQRKHTGLFDWLDVIRHEYTHTISLGRTRNRIPHWLTEAVAVDMEHRRRDFATSQMLAQALEADELFDLEEIDWAFVRPKQATDRALAYAQGQWMIEYLRGRWSIAALVQLLDLYAAGRTQSEAMVEVLQIGPDEFLADFKSWAREQVQQWGLAPSPSMDELLATLVTTAEQGMPEVSDAQVDTWLAAHPGHPDLLELRARRMIRHGAAQETIVPALQEYAAARPADLFPHRQLAAIELASADPQRAVTHLTAIDAQAENDNTSALELVRLHRKAGRRAEALALALRARRIAPYDATAREMAATTAIEAGQLGLARQEIEALCTLEPDRTVHRERLRKLDERIAAAAGAVTPQ